MAEDEIDGLRMAVSDALLPARAAKEQGPPARLVDVPAFGRDPMEPRWLIFAEPADLALREAGPAHGLNGIVRVA